MLPVTFRRIHALAATAALAVALTGCLDTVGNEEDEPQIGGVIVAAANESAATGSATLIPNRDQSDALTLRSGVTNALTVRVLGIDMLDEPVVAEQPGLFEIRFLSQNVPLTSTMGAGYPLSFSVLPEGTGQQTYELQVRSIEHDHVEFSLPILVTVQ